jgi:P pilus assembly chaperone PapD
MRKILANSAEMIARGAPRVIHNDQELAAYRETLFQLTALENPSPSEAEAISGTRIRYQILIVVPRSRQPAPSEAEWESAVSPPGD